VHSYKNVLYKNLALYLTLTFRSCAVLLFSRIFLANDFICVVLSASANSDMQQTGFGQRPFCLLGFFLPLSLHVCGRDSAAQITSLKPTRHNGFRSTMLKHC